MAEIKRETGEGLLSNPAVIGQSLEGPELVRRRSRAELEEQTWTPVPRLDEDQGVTSHRLVFNVSLSRATEHVTRQGLNSPGAFIQARYKSRITEARIEEAKILGVDGRPSFLEIALQLDADVPANGIRLTVGSELGRVAVINGISSSPEWLPDQETADAAFYDLRLGPDNLSSSGTTT